MPIFTSIAIAIGGALGFAATSFFVTATAFVLKTIVGLGVNMLISKLLMPKGPTFHIQGKIRAGATVPRSIMLGFGCTAGSLVYANTWGRDGKTPNAYFTQVIALSDMPINALDGIFIGSERCEIDVDNPHVDYGYPIEEYKVNGTPFLWVKFYDGTQTTADPFLVSKVSSSERPYTDRRIGYGVAYAILTARIKDTLFTGFPEAKFELTGMKLYDISKDSTQGGDGTQRINNPATWGGDGDELLGVQLYNILRGISYNGSWLYGLQRTDTFSLPSAWWIAQINKCRETFEGPDEEMLPSYRTCMEVPVNEVPADVAEALLLGGNGKLTESGGIYKLYLGEPGDSVVTINDDVILSTHEQSFVPFYGLGETITGIEASYPEPDEGWNTKPLDPVYRTDLEELAGNRRLMGSLAINTVPYNPQVQRIVQAALREAERARRHTIVLPPEYWIYEPGDVITWNSTRNGYITKLFRIDGVQDLDNLDVMWDITEVDPTDYDWNPDTDYRPPIIGPIGPIRPTPQPVGGWQVFPDDIRDNAGVARRPSIGVQFDGDDDDIEYARITVRDAVTQDVVFQSDIPYGNPDTNPALRYEILNGVFLPATNYEVQGQFIPISERETLPTAWFPVTTNNTGLGRDDIDPTPPDPVTGLTVDSAGFRILSLSWINPSSSNLDTVGLYYSETNNFANAEFGGSFRGESGVLNLPKTGQLYYVWAEAVSYMGVPQTSPSGPVTGTTLRLPSEMINDDAIIASKIADDAVTELKIAEEAVTQTRIATGAILESKLAANAVTVSKISDGAVEAAKIANGAVSGPKLADLAVTAAKLADNAVTETKISDNAVTTPKLIANAVVADKIAANAVTIRALLIGSFDNLVQNPGAETNTVDPHVPNSIGWTTSGVARSGARSFMWAISVGTNPYIRYDGEVADINRHVSAAEGDKFYLEFYANTQGGACQIRPAIHFCNAAGTVLSTAVGTTTNITSATWVQCFMDATAPAGTAYVVFASQVISTGATATHIRIDDVYARRMVQGNVIVDGTITTGKIEAGSITTALIAAGAITANELAADSVTAVKIQAASITAVKIAAETITGDKIAANTIFGNRIVAGSITTARLSLGSYDNLIQNPGAESNSLEPHYVYNGTWGTSVPRSGSYSFLHTFASTNSSLGLNGNRTDKNAHPQCGEGDSFYFEFYSNRAGSGSQFVRGLIRWMNSDGTSIIGTAIGPTVEITGGAWQRVSMNGTAPAGTAYAAFEIQVLSTGTSTHARFDDIYARRMLSGELIVDGTIYTNNLAALAVTADKIAAGAITTAKLDANAVTAAKIDANSVFSVNAAISGTLTVGAGITISGPNGRIVVAD